MSIGLCTCSDCHYYKTIIYYLDTHTCTILSQEYFLCPSTIRNVDKSTGSLTAFATYFDLQLYTSVYTAKYLCVFLVMFPETVCGRG